MWAEGPALLASLQRATFPGLTGHIALEGQARKELRYRIVKHIVKVLFIHLLYKGKDNLDILRGSA